MLQSIPKLMLCAAAVVLATFVLPAAAPQDVPSSVHGITIPAIPGAPFSAIAVIESEQDWSDGWTEVYRTINIIARDSKGRTHNESRRTDAGIFSWLAHPHERRDLRPGDAHPHRLRAGNPHGTPGAASSGADKP